MTGRRCPIDLAAEERKAIAELAAERRGDDLIPAAVGDAAALRLERGLIFIAAAIVLLGFSYILGGAS